MKSFHKHIILFFLLVGVAIVITEALLYRNLKTHIGLKYEEVLKPEVNSDLIILGTSHAAHGINPCVMDFNEDEPYNFCFNGSTPTYYLKWYKNILRPNYKKPEKVIYAVDWGMFDSTWAQRNFEMDVRYMPFRNFMQLFFEDADVSKKTLLWNRSNIFYNSKSLHHIFYRKKVIEYVDVEQYCKGYAPQVESHPQMGESPKESPIGKRLVADFLSLLEEFEKDSIDVVFINVPEYLPSWKTEVIPERYRFLDSLAASRGIPFINYNISHKSDLNYDKDIYNNWIHLNDEGATKFSKVLSNDLRNLFYK